MALRPTVTGTFLAPTRPHDVRRGAQIDVLSDHAEPSNFEPARGRGRV
jgi:hypothetical protein